MGWLNLMVAVASAAVATWFAYVVFRDIRDVRDFGDKALSHSRSAPSETISTASRSFVKLRDFKSAR